MKNFSLLKRLATLALFFLAVFAGSAAAAFQHHESVHAGTENLRFQAANFWGSDPNASFCFGINGWHQQNEGYMAADEFNNFGSGCLGTGTSYAWMSTRGITSVYPTYYLLGHARWPANQGCTSVVVDILWWNTAIGQYVTVGSEWYEHVQIDQNLYNNNPNGVAWPNLPIGQGYWANTWLYLGYTVDDHLNCSWDGWHVHQSIWATFGYPVSTNGLLLPDRVYDQDDPTYFIHQWTGWG